MRIALICLLLCFAIAESDKPITVGGVRSNPSVHYYKNGYDPLLNMMSAANGAVQGYIDHFTRNKIEPGPDYLSQKEQQESHESLVSTDAIEATESEVDAPPSDNEATKDEVSSEGNENGSEDAGDKDGSDSNSEGNNNGNGDGGAGGDAPDYGAAGENSDETKTEDATKTENSDGSDTENTDDEANKNDGNNTETTDDGANKNDGTNTETTDDGANKNDGTNTETTDDGNTDGQKNNNFSQAPFRVVDDDTTSDVKELKDSLEGLVAKIKEKAANPEVIYATNHNDEEFIRSITKEENQADKEVLEKIQKQEHAAALTADPYEISILHKIGEKVRVIQDAVARQAAGTTQQLPPETIVLKNLVNSVKAMRKQAEEQYQNEPMRVFAKDEKRLRKMEKLLRDMTKLMNDRSLSPKQFNQLSAIYRDRLNQIRRKID